MKDDITNEFYNSLITRGEKELAQLIENGEILSEGVDAIIGYAGKTIDLMFIIEVYLPSKELKLLEKNPGQKENLEKEIQEYLDRNNDRVQEFIWCSLNSQ